MSRKHIKKLKIKKPELKKEDKLHFVLEVQNCEIGQKGEIK